MLNKEQQAFVNHDEKHLMVIGSAGSGKTHSTIQRVKYLVEEKGVDPEKILLSSFTNTGVKELKERIVGEIGLEGELVEMSTLHSWGYRMIKKYYSTNSNGGEKYINGRILFDFPLFMHYNKIFKQLPKQQQEDYNVQLFMNKIANLKKLGITPEMYANQLRLRTGGIEYSGFETEAELAEAEYLASQTQDFEHDVLEFYRMSEEQHKEDATCDANDLIMEAYYVIKKSKNFRDWVCARYDHIMIDEAQDTSKLVHDILALLKDRVTITLIGDAKQSIYGFSMAVAKLFLSFEKEFNADVVSLKRNYRSNPDIVKRANQISDMMTFTSEDRDTMIPEKTGISEINVDLFDDLFSEANSIAKRLEERHLAGEDISDTFILHRTNAQVLMIEQALFNLNVPYVNLSKMTVLDNKIIAGIVGWLRVLADNKDNKAMEMCYNFPNRFLSKDFLKRAKDAVKGKQTLMDSIFEHNFYTKAYEFRACQDIKVYHTKLYKMFREGKINDIIEMLYVDGLIAEKAIVVVDGQETLVNDSPESFGQENVEMLKQTIEKNGLDNFIKFTKNVRSKDGEGVILRTVHSSKGLEADNVYIVGLNDNKFPHRGMMDARETPPEFEHLFGKPIEEELNLFYVAITRAKKNLYLSVPLLDEKGNDCIPSVFVNSLFGKVGY